MLFVLLLPFMPRYLGIPIGDGSISARRIILVFFLVCIVVWMTQNKNFYEFNRMVKRALGIVTVLFMLFFVKALSTVVNIGLHDLLYVIDDILASILIVMYALIFLRSDRWRNILLLMIVISLFLCEILSIIEFIKQAPLLNGLVEIEVQMRNDVAIEGVMRNDLHRVQALFDNPLLLSEFVCIAWPFAWYLYGNPSSTREQLVSLISLMFAPLTLYFVASRAGWIIFAMSIFYVALITVWSKLDKALKLLLILFMSAIFVAMAYLAIDVFSRPTEYFNRTDETGISAFERISQYTVVATALAQQPLLGYGVRQSLMDDLDFLNSLDNYWLRLALESGLFGMFFFIALLFLTIKVLLHLRKFAVNPKERRLVIAITSSLLAFVSYKLFVSIPWNNVYLFLLTGFVIAWRENLKNDKRKCECV